jgi:hypothetical protein
MFTALFWLTFSLAVGALLAALWTGVTARRRLHLVVAPAALVLLAVAVGLAVRMGAERAFPEAAMAVHRPIAQAAGLLALLVAATGVVLWRSGRGRRLHLIAVVLFVLAALAATGSGVWCFLQAPPA